MNITLSKVILLFFVSFSIISCSKEDVSETQVDKVPANVTYNYLADEIEVLDLINDYRQSIELNKLDKIDYVSAKSEEHTNYMVTTGTMNHDFFEERYDCIMATLKAKNVSENLACNYTTAQNVLKAWLNSPGHKANIEGDFTHFGISIRANAEGEKYYTNIFVKR
ncbi:MAG: CAP domain-containing protein [Bacteroidota bacterium]